MIFPTWGGSLAVVAIDVVVGVVVAVNFVVVVVVFVPASTLRGSYGRLDQGAHSGASGVAFSLQISAYSGSYEISMCISILQARTKFAARVLLALGLPPLPVNVRVKWLL